MENTARLRNSQKFDGASSSAVQVCQNLHPLLAQHFTCLPEVALGQLMMKIITN